MVPEDAVSTQANQTYKYELLDLWPGTEYTVRVRAVFTSGTGVETTYVWPREDSAGAVREITFQH